MTKSKTQTLQMAGDMDLTTRQPSMQIQVNFQEES